MYGRFAWPKKTGRNDQVILLYNVDIVRQNTHSNTDSSTQTNVKSGPVTTATIPYIRGTSGTINNSVLEHDNF